MQLAQGVAELLAEIQRLQQALWQREAELATGVPVVASPGDKRSLARRLQAVLRAGVEAVGANAAGVYLLDDGTSVLKLRAVWGLPIRKLADPPRPLRGALADLEALLGHVVVLSDLERMPVWQAPEPGFGAAVCVPLSTETTLLGTLWVFSKQKRDFTPQQTNILELVAGRIATELERQVLLAEAAALKPWKEYLYQLQQWREEQALGRLHSGDGWELGLWKDETPAGWGEFFQQFRWAAEGIGLALGEASGEGIRAVLESVRISTLLEAYASRFRSPHRLLQQVWQRLEESPGGLGELALWVGRLVSSKSLLPRRTLLQYATGGRFGLVRIRAEGKPFFRAALFTKTTPSASGQERQQPLSLQAANPPKPKPNHLLHQWRLGPGDVVILFPYRDRPNPPGTEPFWPMTTDWKDLVARLAKLVRQHLHWPAARLAELAQDVFHEAAKQGLRSPGTLWVLKTR